MDKQKIEFILKLKPPMTDDPYAHHVAGILKRPSWIHPIRRRQFDKQFVNRVQLVLSEYAKQLIQQIELNK